ncbi:MAG: MarR family transcriptional regulator [Gemmatimonadales bacterium]|nr:MAG: MarR family transcriptional regulator [Gemmatimonadales bacterium]
MHATPSSEAGRNHVPAPIPESRALRLWVVLSRAFTSVEAHARADFARHGLTPAEFGALEVLHHKGPLLLGELQKKILVSSGGTTYVIDRLAQRGLVARKRSTSDRRASYVELTNSGTALMTEIFPLHEQVIERALSGIPDCEKETLARMLRQLGLEAARLPVEAPEVSTAGGDLQG